MDRDSVIKIADGRLLTGRLAIEYGLVDGEGDLVDAIEMAGLMAGLGPEPRTVRREETRRVTWFDLLTSMIRWAAAGRVALRAAASRARTARNRGIAMDEKQYDDKTKHLNERLGHGRNVTWWHWCKAWLRWHWYGLRQRVRVK